MALDGADFGMVEDAVVALASLHRLHSSHGSPYPDYDLLDPPSRRVLPSPIIMTVIGRYAPRHVKSTSLVGPSCRRLAMGICP
jgi:hypothetical protein